VTLSDAGLQPILGTTTPKPGYLTTEFWGSWAVKILGTLLVSGIFGDGSTIQRGIGAALTLLGLFGYTYSRTLVKTAGILLVVMFGLGSTQTACGATSKAAGKAALADAVDCTTADRVKLETQFGPTVELALQRAMGGDGKIDLPSLNEIGKALEADGWCVLEKSVARLLLAGMPGTASAAAPLDAADLRAKVGALRAAKFGAVRFDLGPSASLRAPAIGAHALLTLAPNPTICGPCTNSMDCLELGCAGIFCKRQGLGGQCITAMAAGDGDRSDQAIQ
jgi:hypothetical protein